MTTFNSDSTAEMVTEGLDLSGKTVLITGCNSGLGLESARVLAARGAHIIGAARTVEKAQAALAPGHTPVACELSEPASVRACVEALAGRTLDVILCNAGIMALPELEEKHGLELQMLTNHVGHFILVTGLLDQLAPDGRVVILSSGAHHRAPDIGIDLDNPSSEYSPWRQYGQSKLANILFAKKLADRFAGTSQTANALHPGVIPTKLARHIVDAEKMFASLDPDMLKTIPQGAATQCYVAVHPDNASVSGEYFSDCQVAKTSERGRDDELKERLWQWTESYVAKH